MHRHTYTQIYIASQIVRMNQRIWDAVNGHNPQTWGLGRHLLNKQRQDITDAVFHKCPSECTGTVSTCTAQCSVLCDVSQYCSFDAVGCGCDVLLQNNCSCKTSTNPLRRTERQLLEMKAVVVAKPIKILNGSHPSYGPSNPLKMRQPFK